MGGLLTDIGPAWGTRLAEVEGEALRFRIAAPNIRVSRADVEDLCRRMDTSLLAERRTLDQLELALDRQHRRTLRAVRFSRYLDVLASHLSAATSGQIDATTTAADDLELLGTLSQVGADETLGMRVVSAHKLVNASLRQEFEKRILRTASVPRRAARVFAMLLPAFAVERLLVEGMRHRTDVDSSESLLRDLPPAVALVDRDSLENFVGASRPLPPPFTLCHGARAWRQLRAMQAGADATLVMPLHPITYGSRLCGLQAAQRR